MFDSIPQNLTQCAFSFDESPQKCCSTCKEWHPATLEYFGHYKKSKDGLRSRCKSCRHDIEVVADVARHPDKYQKKYQKALAKPIDVQEEARIRQNEAARKRNQKRRKQGMCTSCYVRPVEIGHRCEVCRAYGRKWVKANNEHHQATGKKNRDKLRQQVLNAYGNQCARCGETQPEFLVIDHVNNDSKEHRREVGSGLYGWLRRNGFPQEDFQILCHCCSWRKLLALYPEDTTRGGLWYDRLRDEVLTAYGRKCTCCGESRPDVLTIDHINNDGAQHRREVGAGRAFYSWLRENFFPQEGFQLLCHNCNMAKGLYGACPHQNVLAS